MITLEGYGLALLEIFLFFLISSGIKNHQQLQLIKAPVYYWLMFTVLTGFWELFFVKNYNQVIDKAQHLLTGKEHVWTNKYNITYVSPNKFSQIFYAEYAAYADRDYMEPKDDWSRVIESSHCLLCGLLCLVGFGNIMKGNVAEYYVSTSIAMGSQLMNSILYMVNYFHQTKDSNNVNYITNDFPCGKYLQHRLFMYVNVLWTIMPLYIILHFLHLFRKDIQGNKEIFLDSHSKEMETRM